MLAPGVLRLVSYSLGSDVLRTPKSSSGGLMEGPEEVPLLTSHHGAIASNLL